MNISRLSGRLGALVRSFAHDRRGNYAIIAAITSLPLLTSVAVAIEYANASRMRSELQQRLDAAVLAGASHGNAQVAEAERFFRATFQDNSENQSADGVGSVIKAGFSLGEGVLDGWASRPMEPMFGFGGLTEGKEISVVSQARFLVSEAAAPCITVLANKTQALLVNSGAKIDAERCEVNVHSTEHNAMIMNAQSSLDVSRTCVAGKSILNNGGRIGGLEIGCRPPADPYAGKIPEPTLPASCQPQDLKARAPTR